VITAVDLVLFNVIMVVWRSSDYGGTSCFINTTRIKLNKTRSTAVITRPPDHQYKVRQIRSTAVITRPPDHQYKVRQNKIDRRNH
jgi:hypothetical protein